MAEEAVWERVFKAFSLQSACTNGFRGIAGIKTAERENAAHFAAGRNFAFETTLSGRTYAPMIDRWRADGYSVKLIFLSLASPEEAIARVAMRVRQGGHHVPAETIRRRFKSGLAHFHDTYRARVDFWQLLDNSGKHLRLIEEGTNP